MRRYTCAEEAKLRRVVENHWLRGAYSASEGPTRPHTWEQRVTELEARVITHKLAGHTAEYLLATEAKTVPIAEEKAKTGRKAA